MLYSLLFIGSMMDPYGKIDNLPVAVVKVRSNSKEDIIHRTFMQKNLFSYHELSKKNAESKLKNGEVYGIIEFKQLTNRSQKGETEIYLTTAEGANYAVSKIITAAMERFTVKANQLVNQKEPGTTVRFVHKEAYPIKNNGEGMAPYFFALTLFVGAIATNSVAAVHFNKLKSKFKDYWRNVFFFPLIFIVGEVIFMTGMDYYLLGFGKEHIGILFCLLLFIAITYYSIVAAVNRLFPGTGGLIVLVLTMLQTSSSAGSYAIYLSNPIFQEINKFIPMTYSVMSLRKILSLDNLNIRRELIVLIIFLMVSQVIIYLSFTIHHKKKRSSIEVND